MRCLLLSTVMLMYREGRWGIKVRTAKPTKKKKKKNPVIDAAFRPTYQISIFRHNWWVHRVQI